MENRDIDIEALMQQIKIDSAFITDLKNEIKQIIVGQEEMVDAIITGLLTRGHILLEGLPGLAKTLTIKTMASAINVGFNRIQFTPDLLPADIIGTLIYNQSKGEFVVKKGPIFSNFILADEINRAPAKVQSALLEAMQERQVTIGTESYKLEEPFLVMATQNPIEQEGTYPLPEAQLDRFMLKVKIDYPNKEEERLVLQRNLNNIQNSNVNQVIDFDTIVKARNSFNKIYMDEKIENYILDIVFATRNPEKFNLAKLKPLISFGASPRGSINLGLAAKAHAFIKRRGYVIPEDVRAMCKMVLRHRIGLSYEAEAEEVTQDIIISEIINSIQVP